MDCQAGIFDAFNLLDTRAAGEVLAMELAEGGKLSATGKALNHKLVGWMVIKGFQWLLPVAVRSPVVGLLYCAHQYELFVN
jgi:hypothetical protein